MKKVLNRGFKPAKCKTALQMANSRLKILKNKKEIQIKQLRRELAQLLESGHTPTARIRVEHVVREEKTVAAYELIAIYCELLVVRLGVIESQKNCPIDLKEAVTSVLFASQRLSDVPELSEIVKQFTTKYGKDFATSAIELRPDSGVSRLLVEKLSAKAPDGPTKVKILMAIAEEHNVVWEAQSFVEPDPKDTELLSGASTFQSASSMSMDSSINSNKEQPPNFQAPATVNAQHDSSERHHSPENSYANGGKSSSRSNNVISRKADDYYYPNPRPSRSRTDEGECRNPNHGYENLSSRNKHKWETEFVDSTDAARAAAEAAERASFAARAAAELSSKERMTRQDSTESHVSSASVNLRNEPRRNRPNVQSESFSEEQFSPRQNIRMRHEDLDRTRQDRYDRAKEYEIPSVDQPSERHSLENSRNDGSFGKEGREKQPSEDETDLNVGYSEDVHLRKQSSRTSSHSHSSNYSDENVNGSDYMKSPSIVEENIFATDDDHRSQSSFKDTDTHYHEHDDAAAADTYDDYSSFFDKPKFDAEDNHYQDEIDHGVGFSLLGSKTSALAASWSFKGDHSKSHENHSSSSSQVFQEKPSSPLFDDVSTSPPASYHEPDPHTRFDDYGPDSESDDDQPRHRGKVSGDVHERGNLTSDKSQKFKVSESAGHDFFPLDTEEHKDNSRTREKSDSEPQFGLRLGALAGGFRNKKTLPPYRMSSASSKSEKEYIQTDDFGQSSRKDLYSKKASNTEMRPRFMPPHPSSSDEDDSDMQLPGRTETKSDSLFSHSRVNHDDSEEEKLPTRSSSRSQERTHEPSTGMRDYKRTHFKMPVSASSEDEEDVEREAVRINVKPNKTTGFSLRTKGQAKAHEKHSFPATTKKTDKESHDQPSPRHTTVTSSPVPQTVKSPDPETPSRERASHVHPNLPEYDDIFAKLGALRGPNRR